MLSKNVYHMFDLFSSSLLHIGGQEVLISFLMFSIDHMTSSRGFNELFQFSTYDDSFYDVLARFRPNPVWFSITCSSTKLTSIGLGDLVLMTLNKIRRLIFATLTSGICRDWW